MRIIDSHVHFWRIGAPGQTWPDANWPLIYRDFGLSDLASAIEATVQSPSTAHAVAMDSIEFLGAVLVQSQPDDRDTDWILEIARDTPLIRAVVGWVNLESPVAPARIAKLAHEPKLRSLRPMLQAIEDTGWILSPQVEPALQAMVQQGLRFDALVQPRHLPILVEFAQRWPTLPIVIDHGAKPNIARREIEPWRAQMAELSLLPNVYCKLSGLRTEQAVGAPSAELEPYIRALIECFPQRLMWGSDWPVLLQSRDSYANWFDCVRRCEALQSPSRRDSLFSGAAQDFYG